MADDNELTGRVLLGRYRLESRLGEGGMGSIWRAEHLALGAPVAIKLIDPEIAQDESMLVRFLHEAKAAASLRSPHVVQILDYGVEGARPFIVMELLEGESLRQRLKRLGTLDRPATARILTHVARAVGRAHEAGIIHRDLKPENVFLVHNEDEELAKVLDFGVAKLDRPEALPSATRTRTGTLLGTPHYMSPEQVQGNRVVDYRSDLWSLGVIAFECLVGQRPFDSPGLGDLVLRICSYPLPKPSAFASLPVEFDQWTLRALARDPNERFQSARELAESLREALGTGRPTTYPDDPGLPSSTTGRGTPTAVERISAPAERPPDEPFAPTLVASAGEFESDTEPGQPDFDARLPEPPAPARPVLRELWGWVLGVCLLLGGVAGLLWVRTGAEQELEPADAPSVSASSEPAPIASAPSRRVLPRRSRERASARPSSSPGGDAAAPAASLLSTPPAPSSVPLPDAAPIRGDATPGGH